MPGAVSCAGAEYQRRRRAYKFQRCACSIADAEGLRTGETSGAGWGWGEGAFAHLLCLHGCDRIGVCVYEELRTMPAWSSLAITSSGSP